MLGVKSSIAALSRVIALLTLFIEVDKSPATWNRLWILAGMIAASCAVEFAAYRGIAGRMIHLVLKAAASAMWKRFIPKTTKKIHYIVGSTLIFSKASETNSIAVKEAKNSFDFDWNR